MEGALPPKRHHLPNPPPPHHAGELLAPPPASPNHPHLHHPHHTHHPPHHPPPRVPYETLPTSVANYPPAMQEYDARMRAARGLPNFPPSHSPSSSYSQTTSPHPPVMHPSPTLHGEPLTSAAKSTTNALSGSAFHCASANETAVEGQPPQPASRYPAIDVREQSEMGSRPYYVAETAEASKLLPLLPPQQQQQQPGQQQQPQPALATAGNVEEEGLVSHSPNADDLSNSGSTGGSLEGSSCSNNGSNDSSQEGSEGRGKGDSGLGTSESPSLYDSGSNEGTAGSPPDQQQQQQQQQHLPLKLRWKVRLYRLYRIRAAE